jgi:hypothetical protein
VSFRRTYCRRQSRPKELGTKHQGAEKSEVGGQQSEERGQTTDHRLFKLLNIEQQNKKPQNDEVITSIFEIPCSTFCGSKRR